MYLYIFESGEIMASSRFSDDDKASCDDGILDVIDIGGKYPRNYYEGEWHDLERIAE